MPENRHGVWQGLFCGLGDGIARECGKGLFIGNNSSLMGGFQTP